MKAAILKGKDGQVEYAEIPEPVAREGEVLVKIRAAALNRRDYWITKGLYPNIIYPVVFGSDGCGEVNGKRVIINPNFHWGDNPKFQSKNYSILGSPRYGTLAEWTSVEKDKIVTAPEHLTDEEAAALPLAGMTAYRALFTKCQPKPGEKVLVTGIGGGVALMAAQLAVAAGCEVFVTSGSDEKIERAKALGIRGGVNYKSENWTEILKERTAGVDIIIDGAGGEGFSPLLKIANPGARVAIYGGTRGNIQNLSPQALFWKQITISGTTMATDAEFLEMVAFVNEHKIVPQVDTIFDLKDARLAFERLAKADQFGKIVLRV